jgi:hypothetical protein
VREVAVMCRACQPCLRCGLIADSSLYNVDSVPETGEKVECCYPCARSIRFIAVEGIGGSAEEDM